MKKNLSLKGNILLIGVLLFMFILIFIIFTLSVQPNPKDILYKYTSIRLAKESRILEKIFNKNETIYIFEMNNEKEISIMRKDFLPYSESIIYQILPESIGLSPNGLFVLSKQGVVVFYNRQQKRLAFIRLYY